MASHAAVLFALLGLALAQRETYQGVKIAQGPKVAKEPDYEDRKMVHESEDEQQDLTKFFEDWSKYMSDLSISDLLALKIGAGERRVFFENVKTVPAFVRCAYSVSAEKHNKVVFSVYGPDGAVIITKSNLKESVVAFQANQTGKYLLEFSNKNVF